MEENNNSLEDNSNNDVSNDVSETISDSHEKMTSMSDNVIDNNGGVKEEKPKKKGSVLLIVLLLILAALAALYFFYIKPKRDVKTPTPTNTTVNDEPTTSDVEQLPPNEEKNDNNIIGDLPDYKEKELIRDVSYLSSLTIDDNAAYKNTLKMGCEYLDDDDECTYKIRVKVQNADAKQLDSNNNYYLFKDGNQVKIYSYITKESYIINKLSANMKDYILALEPETEELIGVVFKNPTTNKTSFFSFSLNKILYEDKYDYLHYVAEGYLDGHITKCVIEYDDDINENLDDEDEENDEVTGWEECEDVSNHLLSAKEEKVIKSTYAADVEMDCMDCGLNYSAISNKKATYILQYEGDKLIIYNKDLKELVRNIAYKSFSINSKGYLYTVKKDVITIFSPDGEKVKTVDKYNNIKLLVEDYIVALQDNKNLIVASLDGKEVVLTEWNSKTNIIHSSLSGWYEQDKKAGIYVVVEDSKADKDKIWKDCQKYDSCMDYSKKEIQKLKSNIGYEYYYIPSTGETGKIGTVIGGYAKPVLYLYPTKKTNVTVTFDKPENLTTTYPKYNKSWKVTAYPNGDLYDQNNKYYYALYWEELKNHEISFNEGFYVSKENAIDFLEEKLTVLGLNPRERNEFIMYWLPILENNKHSLVYFEQTKERDNYSKLNITPTPDSILRISMHVKKVDGKVKIKEQKLNTFNRTGFSAVEWGGVIH